MTELIVRHRDVDEITCTTVNIQCVVHDPIVTETISLDVSSRSSIDEYLSI